MKKTINVAAIFLFFVSFVSLATADSNNNPYAKAYIDILKQNETAIKDYFLYGANDEYTYRSGEELIAIADICGDATPELLFVKDNDKTTGYLDYANVDSELLIYTYDGSVREILREDFGDNNTGGGANNRLFTAGGNGFYIFEHDGFDPGHVHRSFTQYTLKNGRLVPADVFFHRTSYPEDVAYWIDADKCKYIPVPDVPDPDQLYYGYEETVHLYRQNSRNLTEDEYKKAVAGIVNSADALLFQNFIDDEYSEDPIWNFPDIPKKRMTYEQAINFLEHSTLTARPTASKVLVDGATVSFDAYNINDNNYFKLRDLAYVLRGTSKQFEVGWNGASNTITLTRGVRYTPVGGEMSGKGAGNKTPAPTTSKITLDGKTVSFTAYNIGGNNYFKLRDIGAAFDFGVDWAGANNAIVIDTRKGYTPVPTEQDY